MASRLFQPMNSLDRGVIKLFGSMKMGTAGSIASQDTNGFTIVQVASLAGSSSLIGSYQLNIQESYPSSPANYVATGAVTSPFLGLDAVSFTNGMAAQHISTNIISESIATNSSLTVRFDSAADTAINPASGSVVYFEISLKNSSTPRKGS